jgi:hypothetical protein
MSSSSVKIKSLHINHVSSLAITTLLYFCTMANKWTTITQKSHSYMFRHYRVILREYFYHFVLWLTNGQLSHKITLLRVSSLSCHPQGVCIQCLAKLHKYFKCSSVIFCEIIVHLLATAQNNGNLSLSLCSVPMLWPTKQQQNYLRRKDRRENKKYNKPRIS